jgi:hypothetical protein
MRWFVALALIGCASPRVSLHRAPVYGATQQTVEADPAVEWIERALADRGLELETDGTTRSLYEQLRRTQTLMEPEAAEPGDVLFFDLESDGRDCGNHAGIVERVDPDGRVVFREWRGELRHSYLHPDAPVLRRDAHGRVLNTFLRSLRPGEPPRRIFAGDTLCAVVRVQDGW